MTKTAVEFIEDYLKFKGIIIDDKTIPQVLVGVINQAKEMFEQQIIDAYWEGCSNWDEDKDAEQYYNETFKK
jgi:ferredoxin-fold anticodon binding domain-containing protein